MRSYRTEWVAIIPCEVFRDQTPGFSVLSASRDLLGPQSSCEELGTNP